jgi:uncharacterized protein (DUF924 family)
VSPAEVLAFWFAGDPSRYRKEWFERSTAFDAACSRFTEALGDAKAGAFDHWTETPCGTLALIILLDQFSRNLNRHSPEAFAADPKSIGIARAAIARGVDQALGPLERMFLYLPFMHSERIEEQDESVRLFSALGEEARVHAEGHRQLIRRFGRFPHRNQALGRPNTADEIAHLEQRVA